MMLRPLLVLAAATLALMSSDLAAESNSLSGDWGGVRSKLRADGIELSAHYTSESAFNFSGGDRHLARETGQFDFGATIDTGKLFGLTGGTLQATVTYRRGVDLGAAANLGVLQQVQEIFGRGQTWRLTQLWYEQALAGGSVAVKAGRLTVGEDFAAFSCDFMNLTFCGAPPGNIVDYWFNWPVSQWGARVKVKTGKIYVQAGAYENNPKNLKNEFTIGFFSRATGAIVIGEAGWTPEFGAAKLPGSYKLGVWYDSAAANDVLLDVNRQPQVLTGLPALTRSGRYGAYINIQQQVTGSADGNKTTSGLSIFLNITQADRRTATTDNQIALGLFYNGPWPSRPDDVIGLALGRTHVNGRVAEAERLDPLRPPVQHSEYAAEVFYGLQATPWLVVQPNLQWVHDPGGRKDRTDVAILGLKAALTF